MTLFLGCRWSDAPKQLAGWGGPQLQLVPGGVESGADSGYLMGKRCGGALGVSAEMLFEVFLDASWLGCIYSSITFQK